MPRRRRVKRSGKSDRKLIWKEYSLIFLTANQTKYFNTTDFEKANDRPWRLSHILVDLVSPQIGAVAQVDILDVEGLSIASTGPYSVGSNPVKRRVTNPNKIWVGSGRATAYNLVGLKSLCTNSALQTVQITGVLTVVCELHPEIMRTICPTLCVKTQEEIDAMSSSFDRCSLGGKDD